MDAIMVGAETVRRDNPSLITRSPECAKIRKKQKRAPHPIKVTITSSGNLDPHAAFFTEGETEKIVLAKGDAKLDPAIELSSTVIRFQEDWWPALECALAERGAESLMIEGGAQLIHHALDERIADHWRVAVSEKILGETGHAHVMDVETLASVPPLGVTISKPQKIGGMQVYWIGFDRPHADAAGVDGQSLRACVEVPRPLIRLTQSQRSALMPMATRSRRGGLARRERKIMPKKN